MFPATRTELLPYLQKHWKALALLVIGILLPLLLVMDLTEDVFSHHGFSWDVSILAWWRSHRTPQLTALAEALGVIGGVKVLPFITLAVALLLARFDAKVHGWFLVMSVAGASLINVLAKLIFQRPRPDELGAVLVEKGFSFPSGHTMANAAFGIALAFIFWSSPRTRIIGILGILWGVLLGLSRNYLGVHYPTDVLVGFLTSLAWVAGLRLLMRQHWPKLEKAPETAVKAKVLSD